MDNCDDDDEDVKTFEVYDYKKFKGREVEYDNDIESHSLLMRNNPLETFSKTYQLDNNQELLVSKIQNELCPIELQDTLKNCKEES